MRFRRAARVILIGAPGVGKGTQSQRLLDRFPDLQSISTGDLLRGHVKDRTPLGIKVEGIIRSGGLVADDLMMRVLSNELYARGWLAQARPPVYTLSASSSVVDSEMTALSSSPPPSSSSSLAPPPPPSLSSQSVDCVTMSSAALDAHTPPQASDHPSASFILDGFPRTEAQASVLDRIVPINLAVAIRTPFEVILSRIAGRWVHEPSGRVYNTTFNRPKVPGRDDDTGERLVKRPDDDEEVYRTRFRRFQDTSEPLIEHYRRRGVLWEVDGMSSDEISPKMYHEFERRFTSDEEEEL